MKVLSSRCKNAGEFRNTVVLIDKYDSIVCELEPDGSGYWKIPTGAVGDYPLDIGDVFRVEEIETENPVAKSKRRAGLKRKADVTESDMFVADEKNDGCPDGACFRDYVHAFPDNTFLLVNGWGYPTVDGGSSWTWSLWNEKGAWQRVINEEWQMTDSDVCIDYSEDDFGSLKEALDDFNTVWGHPTANRKRALYSAPCTAPMTASSGRRASPTQSIAISRNPSYAMP